MRENDGKEREGCGLQPPKPLFTILVVALNPGEKLKKTVDSILKQEWTDYEILVKDGMSEDGAVEALQAEIERSGRELSGRLRILRAPDKGIYDAMNQAVMQAKGRYVLFLNCGDIFFGKAVLSRAAASIQREEDKDSQAPCIFYGNTLCEKTGAMVHSAPKITGFTCYRNIPCHQSCFYDRRLFKKKQYDLSYRIRADYDHFLWCYYRGGARMIYMDMTVSAYEGGGYSESPKNRARDRAEHKQITTLYMTRRELIRYQAVMLLTLAPLRRRIAESRRLAGIYHKAKAVCYCIVRAGSR